MMNKLTLIAVACAWSAAGCASQYCTTSGGMSAWGDRFADALSTSKDCRDVRRIDCTPEEFGPGTYHFGKFDEKALEAKLKECASEALDEIEDVTGQEFSDDFEDGFEQAFVDLSQNRKGILPAVPPPRYWHAYYRAPVGRRHVYDWYAGYELGTQEAFRAGIHTWTEVVSLAALYGAAGPGCLPAHYVSASTTPQLSTQVATASRPQVSPPVAVPPQPLQVLPAAAPLQRVDISPQAAPVSQAVNQPEEMMLQPEPQPEAEEFLPDDVQPESAAEPTAQEPVVPQQTTPAPSVEATSPAIQTRATPHAAAVQTRSTVSQPTTLSRPAARPQLAASSRTVPVPQRTQRLEPTMAPHASLNVANLPAQPQRDYRAATAATSSNPAVNYRQDAGAGLPRLGIAGMDYRGIAPQQAVVSVQEHVPGALPRPASSPSVRGY